MSRDIWHKRTQTETDYETFKARHKNPERLSNKTSDPAAADYDEANEIFANGLKLARIGDFDAAVPQIATAYLLDGRSINFKPSLANVNDADAKNFMLDLELLYKLIHHDTTTFGCSVLHILLAGRLGSTPDHGQEIVGIALVRIDNLISYLEKDPEIEAPNSMFLGGCLTRKELLYQKSTLRMALGDYKNAIKDLTKALEIDEFYTKARAARACIWAGQKLRSDARIHEEFCRIIQEQHVDNRGNEVAYAFLALKTLGNSSLGTYTDAKSWYDKMLSATKRRDEIYGTRRQDELPPAVRTAKQKFLDCGNLEIFDAMGVERITLRDDSAPKQKRACLTCGATSASDGGVLSKCTRCKSAFYCSRECQVKDWKEHKKLCKIVKAGLDAKERAGESESAGDAGDAVDESSNPPAAKDEPAQEVLDTWTSNAEAAKRLENELRNQFQKFGNDFSKWWGEMGVSERKRIMTYVTDDTISLSEIPRPEIAKMLRDEGRGRGMSAALFDYNVESLCGSEKSEGKLIEEMKEWANNPEKKDEENIQISTALRSEGIFPDMFEGKLAFVNLPTKDEVLGKPMVFNETCPPEEVLQFRDYIEQGMLYDASAAQYAISRKILALSLFAKLFDEYSLRVRRIPAIHPMERLNGCNRCNRSCQEESAKQCQVCKTCWFCSQGCMVAAGHVPCPHNKEYESKANFK